MAMLLKLEKISKSFIQRGLLLDKLDLDVNEGASLAITGPSGSGKTTLMNLIGSLDKPDSGDIYFEGKSILNLKPDESAHYRNRNIGFIFQDHLLLPHLTILENILLPLYAFRISGSDFISRREFATDMAEKTGISGILGKYPFQISGGEAQRATLVRALINNPSLLLADEPTGSLDAKNADLLGDLLVEMNAEFHVTLITVTHSAALASKMKNTLRLEEGKLVG
jgi:lipoprotein-releasing system ATP-binding protein